MKVLLISANTERLNLPALPLGLALVGAAAREVGHDVTFLNLMFRSGAKASVRRAVAASRPYLTRGLDQKSLRLPNASGGAP